MSKLDKDEVLAKFTEAYKAANNKEPQIEAKSGWYSIDGGKNIRLAQIVELTEALSGDKPAEAAPAKKAEPAPKAEKKAPAKKPAAKKAKSGFSVKSFWGDKITENNAGSILPR